MSGGANHILGVSPLQDDSSAALLRDGVVVAAIENDKLTRMRTPGMPDEAIAFCLREGRVSSAELDCLAIASRPTRAWLRRALNRVGMAKELSGPQIGVNGGDGNGFRELSPVHGGDRAERSRWIIICAMPPALFFNLLSIAPWWSSWMRVEMAAPDF